MNNNKFVQLKGLLYCLKADLDFFKNKEQTDNKSLYKMQRKVVMIEYGATFFCESELIRAGEDMYYLTHTCSRGDGWPHIRTFVIRSSANLVDIYEHLCDYKPIPTWVIFVEFVKECTLLQF